MATNLPHLITISDLFSNFDLDKLKGKGNIKKTYKCADKMALTKKIFIFYMRNLFEEFIKGGQVFIMPGPSLAKLQFRELKDSTLKTRRSKGLMNDVDLLVSGFKYYEPILVYPKAGRIWIRPIKLSENFNQQLKDKVNSGYKYC